MPCKGPTPRLRINQLRETLPGGWQIFETIDRDNLFRNSSTRDTSWDHTNPEIDRVLYAPLPDYPDATFEPNYEALSYIWGDELPQKAIRVMTLPPPQVPITVVNAAEAPGEHCEMANTIRHLRISDRARMLWIGSICINQRDDKGNSAQVKRIGQIYALASAVIVWLSHGEDNAVRGLETLSAFGNEIGTYQLLLFPYSTGHASGLVREEHVSAI